MGCFINIMVISKLNKFWYFFVVRSKLFGFYLFIFGKMKYFVLLEGRLLVFNFKKKRYFVYFSLNKF